MVGLDCKKFLIFIQHGYNPMIIKK